MRSSYLFIAAFIIAFTASNAQSPKINKIEPPNWWTGMVHNEIQLMVYGENLNGIEAGFSGGIDVKKIHVIDNPNYAFIDIKIPEGTSPGDYTLTLSNPKGKSEFSYPVWKRIPEEGMQRGFGPEDIIYLIVPDRFADGNPDNNVVEGFGDQYNRENGQGRHGGDIQGIINRLDYLKELGITAIWSTPLVENENFMSYHGYGATDLYNVDARFGNNELYKKLVEEAHKRGIKTIYDHVANHISIEHPWMADLPMPEWINGSATNFFPPNHGKQIFADMYSDSLTYDYVTEGWFTHYLPDLNHENPFTAQYIIQNTIWWIEYAGLDGIREDTYPYANQEFMAQWAEEIFKEYPDFNIVGEVWTGETQFLAWWQKDSPLRRDYNSNLPSLMDFGIRDVLNRVITGTDNMHDVYNRFAMDYLYVDPNMLVTFTDNHDVDRSMLFADGNVDVFKLAHHILFTTRGIPQLFYGTEIGMEGGRGHGPARADFPGGFPGDERDAFTESGRTDFENDIFTFFQKYIDVRKKHKSLTLGSMVHFPPENDVYTYFRIYEDEKIMSVVNNNDTEMEVDFYKMRSRINAGDKLVNLLTGEEVTVPENLKITFPAKQGQLFLVE